MEKINDIISGEQLTLVDFLLHGAHPAKRCTMC